MKRLFLAGAFVFCGLSVARADEMCSAGFKGCADGAIYAYESCQDEIYFSGEACPKTAEDFKMECMRKYPDCADRAYLDARFAEALARSD